MLFWGIDQFFICAAFLTWDLDNAESSEEAETSPNLAVSYGCRVYSFPCDNIFFLLLIEKAPGKQKDLER